MVGILAALADAPLMAQQAKLVAGLVAMRVREGVAEVYTGMADGVKTDGIGALFAMAGKDQGAVRPPRPPHAPGETYRRLAHAIGIHWHASRARTLAMCSVGIVGGRMAPDPSPKYPDGTPLEFVDSSLNGPPKIIGYEESRRSIAYSIMVKEGRGGYGRSKGTGQHLPDDVAVNSAVILTSRGGKRIWRDAREHAWVSLAANGADSRTGILASIVRAGLTRGGTGK